LNLNKAAFLLNVHIMKFGKGIKQQGLAKKEQRLGKNKGGAMGPGGFCICAKCGEKITHQQGIKCTKLKCPKCGHTMVREELLSNKK
jgi:hypothetical protein